MSAAVTHVGFSDESNWNRGRFRSLGLVTTSLEHLAAFEREIRALLSGSQVREFKWKRLDGAKERFAAEKLCNFAVDKACAGQLRVDVLVWDIEDSRHRIAKRDDIANLERMYYHLFRNVLRARWPHNAVWKLHPDEHTAFDWETIRDCLENVGTRVELDRSLFTSGGFRLRLKREFGIEEIAPVSSEVHPLLQLADLIAGMGVFSRERFNQYKRWLEGSAGQQGLFGDESDGDRKAVSRSAGERCRVLAAFDALCKKRRLGVSLNRKRGLWTPDPRNPLNFWLYEPQHPQDKAPVRKGGRDG